MADNRTLPKKEAALFKDVVEFHDRKQYKKGLKTADSILQKFPNHGETLAMKGLIMNCMDRKSEAYDLVKLGIKNDMRSHVAWHVLGLLHRSDRNYKEAIKCYLQALRIDPENQQILRDLSWLQIQLLDVKGFIETRRKILVSKPTNKQHWIAFAVGNFLGADFRQAKDVMDQFFQNSTEERTKYENSELLLFHNRILANMGDMKAALDHLISKEADIVDKNAFRVKAAEYLSYCGRHDESLEMWLDLIKDQPDNYRYHAGAHVAALKLDNTLAEEMFSLKRLELPCTVMNLWDEQRAVLASLYGIDATDGTVPRIKSSRSSRKISLSLHPSPESFRAALDQYMRKMLEDGVPSLCHDVCALMMKPDECNTGRNIYVRDPSEFRSNEVCRVALVLVTEYIDNLRQNGTFFKSSVPVTSLPDEPPTCLLWALFLRCHLLEMCGRYREALVDIDACLMHTPTALDMHIKKGRILKRLGDIEGASLIVNECRALDLQDRYLNNKATKYYLRANNVSRAMETIAMFTKDEGMDPQYALYDLQCVWYELEAGEAYARLEKYGPALKKFYAVQKHFLDFIEDKFDFHGYCIRKGTLAAYLDLTKMLENVLSHKNFQRASRGAMRIFLDMLNPKSKETAKTDNGDDGSDAPMTAAEKQKAKLKARKSKKKESGAEVAVAAEAQQEVQEGAKKGNSSTSSQQKDEDPQGDKLLLLDPIKEALQWASTVARNAKSDPETQELVCAVYLKKGKLVQALRAISCGLSVAPGHPGLVSCLVQAARIVEGINTDGYQLPVMNPIVEAVVRSELSRLLNGLNSMEYLRQFLESEASTSSLAHCTVAARLALKYGVADPTQFFTNRDGALPVDETQTNLLCLQRRGVNANAVRLAHEFLQNELKNEGVANIFKAESLKLFPFMNYFGGSAKARGVFEEDDLSSMSVSR